MSPVDRQGGEARNHEAEVEAAAKALMHVINSYCPQWDRRIDWEASGYAEQAKIDAGVILDAVRCAQGRDTDAPDAECDTTKLVEAAQRVAANRLVTDESFDYVMVPTEDQAALVKALAGFERSPQDEDHELDHAQALAEDAAGIHTPVPQGEDHDAGIKAALRAFDDAAMGGFDSLRDEEWPEHAMRQAIAAYLSRCPSPERLGELLDGETNA